jgi:hypothetical protein
LHTAATLSADRCHFNDVTVRVDRDDGNDAAIRKEYVINASISVDEYVAALARHLIKLMHESPQIVRRQRK